MLADRAPATATHAAEGCRPALQPRYYQRQRIHSSARSWLISLGSGQRLLFALAQVGFTVALDPVGGSRYLRRRGCVEIHSNRIAYHLISFNLQLTGAFDIDPKARIADDRVLAQQAALDIAVQRDAIAAVGAHRVAYYLRS